MLTQMKLKNSKRLTVESAIDIDVESLISVIREYDELAQTARMNQRFYSNVIQIALVHFNRAESKSGNVALYRPLANGVYIGGVMLSVDSRYDEFAAFALERLRRELTERYEKRIERAIENGRDYINLTKTKTLIRLFRIYVEQRRDVALQLTVERERLTETEKRRRNGTNADTTTDERANNKPRVTLEKRIINGVETTVYHYHTMNAANVTTDADADENAAVNSVKKNVVIPYSFEIVHDIIEFLIANFTNADERHKDRNAIIKTLDLPFDEFRALMKNRLYDVITSKYVLYGNDFVIMDGGENAERRITEQRYNAERAAVGEWNERGYNNERYNRELQRRATSGKPRGIYRIYPDGNVKPRIVLESQIINGVLCVDSMQFGGVTKKTKSNKTPNLFYNVTRHITFYRALYMICERAVGEKRRNAERAAVEKTNAAAETDFDERADVNATDTITDIESMYESAIENAFDTTDAECKDLYNALYTLLIFNGVRINTAQAFIRYTVFCDLFDGVYKDYRKRAAERANLTAQGYNKIRAKYYDVLRELATNGYNGESINEKRAAVIQYLNANANADERAVFYNGETADEFAARIADEKRVDAKINAAAAKTADLMLTIQRAVINAEQRENAAAQTLTDEQRANMERYQRERRRRAAAALAKLQRRAERITDAAAAIAERRAAEREQRAERAERERAKINAAATRYTPQIIRVESAPLTVDERAERERANAAAIAEFRMNANERAERAERERAAEYLRARCAMVKFRMQRIRAERAANAIVNYQTV